MNKPRNERIEQSYGLGTQLRYVSKQRIRKLRARHRAQGLPLNWRACGFGPFYSWLKPV